MTYAAHDLSMHGLSRLDRHDMFLHNLLCICAYAVYSIPQLPMLHPASQIVSTLQGQLPS